MPVTTCQYTSICESSTHTIQVSVCIWQAAGDGVDAVAHEVRKAEARIHARERQWLEKRAMELSNVLHREYYPAVQQNAPMSLARRQPVSPPASQHR
jgi:hypothetical protein